MNAMAAIGDAVVPLCELLKALDSEKALYQPAGPPVPPSQLKERARLIRAQKLKALKNLSEFWPFAPQFPHTSSSSATSKRSSKKQQQQSRRRKRLRRACGVIWHARSTTR